jgi:hypothetical protein
MMFLHEQNETEHILIEENLWPLSMVCKPLFFPSLGGGKKFQGGTERKRASKKNPIGRLAQYCSGAKLDLLWEWLPATTITAKCHSHKKRTLFPNIDGICFKALDHVRGQGAPRLESGAYTIVREHFKPWGNAAIGRQTGLYNRFRYPW